MNAYTESCTYVCSKPHYEVEKITHEAPALDEYQVLIKVKACGVCHTDVMFADLLPPGAVLGHEAVGEVVEFGPKVEHLKRGELVGYVKLNVVHA